jgi:glycosyltransferase involved in cell wall biosynthesis
VRVLIERPWTAPYRVAVGQQGVDFVYARHTRVRRLGEWTDAFRPVVRSDVDLMHMTNSVPVPARRPFVLSFEDYCPRVPDDRKITWLEHAMARLLANDSCRAIMPWSSYARRQATQQMAAYSFGREVIDKMNVVPPPVRIRTDRPKFRNAQPRLVFVGREFVRKGGVSVVLAHRRLRALGVPVETTLVTTFAPTPRRYIRVPEKYADCSEILASDGLTLQYQLDNEAVLDLIDGSDYLVLPTLHDSYGYSAVEAIAGATPVISTHTAAQPDIIEHGNTGWLLPIENDSVVGKWVWTGRGGDPGYDEAFEATVESLAVAVAETILQHRDMDAASYETMSANALEAARSRMSDDVVRGRVERIYAAALMR